jgi:hypothetical protein
MMKCLLFSLSCSFQFLFSLSQVPVSKEPRHHNIFENDHVRVLDVHIPPSDTTQIHIHATPSVFVILTNHVKVGSQVISEEKRANLNTSDNDNIWFEGFYTTPRIHRVWNSDTKEYHVMDIELTNKNYIDLDPPIQQEAFTFLFDQKLVRAYRIRTSASEIHVPARKAGILIIQLSDSDHSITINEKPFHKMGDFIYVPSGNRIGISADSTRISEFAFFELR